MIQDATLKEKSTSSKRDMKTGIKSVLVGDETSTCLSAATAQSFKDKGRVQGLQSGSTIDGRDKEASEAGVSGLLYHPLPQ